MLRIIRRLVPIAAAIMFASSTIANQFNDEDLSVESRRALLDRFGYPTKVEITDSKQHELGSNCTWTYYFESRDGKLLPIHFVFDKEKLITRETLDQGGMFK